MDIETIYAETEYGKFIVDPRDGVCNKIAAGEFWDQFLKEHFDKLTKETFVADIGSHIGFHTVYLARKCHYVYSFEPQKVNYDRLIKNCELNNIKNVMCFELALFRKNCKMDVNHQPDQTKIDYSNCQACSLSLYENEKGDIEAKTLDSLNIPWIDFIKIDAEGCDLEIINGGLELIKKCRPTIIFESNLDKSHQEREAKEIFDPLKYQVKEITASNWFATPINK